METGDHLPPSGLNLVSPRYFHEFDGGATKQPERRLVANRELIHRRSAFRLKHVGGSATYFAGGAALLLHGDSRGFSRVRFETSWNPLAEAEVNRAGSANTYRLLRPSSLGANGAAPTVIFASSTLHHTSGLKS